MGAVKEHNAPVTAPELSSILKESSGRVIIPCWIQPRASVEKIVAVLDGALKISLKAPPVDGKANAALEKFLAAKLGLSKSAVRLTSGPASRRKIIEADTSLAEAIAALSQ